MKDASAISRRRPAVLAVFVAVSTLAAAGCAARNQSNVTLSVSPDYATLAPRSIAVLPFDNMSADLDATPLVRPIVAGRLKYKGYDVPDLDAVDRTLKNEGVMVSHDVYAFTAQELGDMLGVDAVMFGTITDFTTKYAVVYASVAVQLKLELVDCKSGDVLWQNEQRAAENTALESILTLLSYHDDPEKGLVVVGAANAIWAALEKYQPYAEAAAAKTLAPLPPGYKGARPYPWNPNDRFPAKVIIYRSVIITSPP